jgi:negative regulator of flagellin synthesis FlgM
MTIERVGVPDPISRFNKTQKASKPERSASKDSISLSEDAKSKAEIYSATETVKMSSDIRTDRVEEVKRKLEDPNYITERVIEELAEKLMDHFKI